MNERTSFDNKALRRKHERDSSTNKAFSGKSVFLTNFFLGVYNFLLVLTILRWQGEISMELN